MYFKVLLKSNIMKIEIDENGKWQNSMTLKVLILAVMGIFLLIPLEMIKSIIIDDEPLARSIVREYCRNRIKLKLFRNAMTGMKV